VEVHIRRLTLDPFRGLVAKEVSVLDVRDRKRVLAWVDEMLLGVNYAAAIRGETFLDSADLRDANLWLPLNPKKPDGPKFEIRKLNARLFLPPRQIYLARAQAEVYGIQVFASGRLINPQVFQPTVSGQNAFIEVGEQVVEELSKLRFEKQQPTLTLTFAGDLAQPSQVQADLRFEARDLRRKAYEVKTLDLVATCRKGVVELQQLHAVDRRGELRAAGTYDLDSRNVALRVRSTLHLAEIERAVGWFPDLDDWELHQPPQLEFTVAGSAQPDSALRISGNAELHDSAFRKIPFQKLSMSFSRDQKAWSVRDLRLAHTTGELSGDITCRPGEFRARLQSTLNPGLIATLLNPEEAEWLRRFDFAVSPTLQLEIRGAEPTLESCTGMGQITYSRVLYQGRAAVPAVSALEFREQVLTVSPFTLEHDAGGDASLLRFDFARHEVLLEKAQPVTPSPE
jgi:hypothetical protein